MLLAWYTLENMISNIRGDQGYWWLYISSRAYNDSLFFKRFLAGPEHSRENLQKI